MLWTIVMDFYIRYIFGGFTSTNVAYGGFFGRLYNGSYSNFTTLTISGLDFKDYQGNVYNMCFGNYLSLIATIITMVIILVLCCWFIKKIIAIVFRLFNGGNVF